MSYYEQPQKDRYHFILIILQEDTGSKDLTRKRKCQPSKWKAIVRKVDRQHVQSYASRKGTALPEKQPKLDDECGAGCAHRCKFNFPDNVR